VNRFSLRFTISLQPPVSHFSRDESNVSKEAPMFETSVIQARAQAASGRLSLLTISLIAHSAVIVGAIAYSIASVDFPSSAPDAYEHAPVFVSLRIPPPLGIPDGGAKREPQQQKQSTPPPQPAQITAPSTVPETITPGTAAESTAPSTGIVDGPVGVPWGVKDSIGDMDAPPIVNTLPPPVEEKIYQPHEVKAPVLLHKVDPLYPRIFQRAGMAATVVIRCVIDKNGHVRDPQVVVSGKKPFDDEVINAVQQWRYTPASLRGEAVDSYLDVTVHFEVKR
jgi:TonB family protein